MTSTGPKPASTEKEVDVLIWESFEFENLKIWEFEDLRIWRFDN
jgi:hypothetical protein